MLIGSIITTSPRYVLTFPARGPGHRFDPAHFQESLAHLFVSAGRVRPCSRGTRRSSSSYSRTRRLRSPFASISPAAGPGELRRARESAPLHHAAVKAVEAGWLHSSGCRRYAVLWLSTGSVMERCARAARRSAPRVAAHPGPAAGEIERMAIEVALVLEYELELRRVPANTGATRPALT